MAIKTKRPVAYEDTGLTPEEIVKLNDFSTSQCAKLLAENGSLRAEVERLNVALKLLESDRDAERKIRLDAEAEADAWRRREEAVIAENARLRAELEAAKRDLALVPMICFGDCSGDPDVGVPDCPFYDYVEPDSRGYPQKRECRYATKAMRAARAPKTEEQNGQG